MVVPALVIAHAELVDSDPADGSTITTPYTLTATFAEEIDPDSSTLFVENVSGQQVATGTVDTADTTMMTAELPQLPNGIYSVRWTSVTPDDNGIERGTFTFNVAAAAPSVTPSPTLDPTFGMPQGQPDTTVSGDLLFALLLAALGIVAVVAFVLLRGRRR